MQFDRDVLLKDQEKSKWILRILIEDDCGIGTELKKMEKDDRESEEKEPVISIKDLEEFK